VNHSRLIIVDLRGEIFFLLIKDWQADEKRLQSDAAALSAELQAIFLHTGVNGIPAVDLARWVQAVSHCPF